MVANPWCEILGIEVPRLEAAKNHAAASSYSLLLVALLERGKPMTLPEVALRFEQAGIAPHKQALASIKKSRPARAPVYRRRAVPESSAGALLAAAGAAVAHAPAETALNA